MADALRNTQLPSGYDEEFVYEVEDDFLCLICQLPLKEPVQTICGHDQILQSMPRGTFEKVRLSD